jgi:hypothetical protein
VSVSGRLSLALLFGASVSGGAIAGTASLTEAGVKSIGSGVAAVANCEMEKFLPSGTLGGLMATLRDNLTKETWRQVADQYRRSLHEKTQYQVSTDRWLKFAVNESNCRSLAKAIPVIESSVRQFNK